VLPRTTSRKLLQPVARRYSQVGQGFGCIQDHQPAESRTLQVGRPSSYRVPPEEPFCVRSSEGPNHRLERNALR
jgi:hypothetical protein